MREPNYLLVWVDLTMKLSNGASYLFIAKILECNSDSLKALIEGIVRTLSRAMGNLVSISQDIKEGSEFNIDAWSGAYSGHN